MDVGPTRHHRRHSVESSGDFWGSFSSAQINSIENHFATIMRCTPGLGEGRLELQGVHVLSPSISLLNNPGGAFPCSLLRLRSGALPRLLVGKLRSGPIFDLSQWRRPSIYSLFLVQVEAQNSSTAPNITYKAVI